MRLWDHLVKQSVVECLPVHPYDDCLLVFAPCKASPAAVVGGAMVVSRIVLPISPVRGATAFLIIKIVAFVKAAAQRWRKRVEESVVSTPVHCFQQRPAFKAFRATERMLGGK